MLSINNLSISYENNEILDGLDLNLDHGEIFALLGQSGCGKSSTLRFIAGLDCKYRNKLVLEVREILKKSNMTSILVTHDEEQARAFADKTGNIKNKKLELLVDS